MTNKVLILFLAYIGLGVISSVAQSYNNPTCLVSIVEQADTIKSPLGIHIISRYKINEQPLFNAHGHAFYSKGIQVYKKQPYLENIMLDTANWKSSNAYILLNDAIVPCFYSFDDKFEKWYRKEEGELLKEKLSYSYYKQDTIVSCLVFNPNPILSAQASYGKPFKDLNDSDAWYFEKAYFSTHIPAKYDESSGYYYPNADIFILKELSPPNYLLARSKEPNFNFKRNEPGFEDINALYHLTQMATNLKKIGFECLLDTLYVDSHALNGQDQSAFNGIRKPFTLEFGVGGVDDAEDGEVVIHEYAHSLSAKASFPAPEGFERNCMEEGFADYLAKDYANGIRVNPRSNKVFSWDGHNEFWSGYEINTADVYSQFPIMQKRQCRQLWSSALMCLKDELGPYADTLILEHLFFQYNHNTMQEMAEIFLLLDSIFTQGNYYWQIKQCFVNRGILTLDARDIVFGEEESPLLLNSYLCALYKEPVEVRFKSIHYFNVELVDVWGKVIWKSDDLLSHAITLDPKLLGLVSGSFYVRVRSHTLQKDFYFKLLIP